MQFRAQRTLTLTRVVFPLVLEELPCGSLESCWNDCSVSSDSISISTFIGALFSQSVCLLAKTISVVMCGCSSTVGVVRLRLRSVNANQRMQCCCWSTSSVITTSKQRNVDFVFVRFACRSYAAIYAGSSVAPVQRCLLAPSACSRAALICCQSANVLSIFVQLFVCSSTLVARQRTHDGRNAIVDWRLLATT